MHPHPHAAYGVYARLFRLAAAAAGLLHVKASAAAVLSNLPGAWRHRHSLRVPLDVQRRTNWERATTAAGKVLGSMGDHPAVAAAAADVVLCAAGLGLWAAVRGVGVDEILGCAVPFYKPAAVAAERSSMGEMAKQEDIGAEKTREQQQPAPRSGGRKSIAGAAGDDRDAATTGTRRRGRPRKAKAEPELATETESVAADATYAPEPGVAAEVAEGDRLEADDDWEAAAVAWGITALRGLGAGSASVFGAECIARGEGGKSDMV